MSVWISSYDRLGIPTALAGSFVVLILGLCLIPYFRGYKIGQFDVPNLDRSVLILLKYIGPITLIISLVSFYPVWPDPNTFFVNSPRCKLNIKQVEHLSYKVSWFVDTTHPTEMTVNNTSVVSEDTAEYYFNGRNNYERFNLKASNRWGKCSSEVIITAGELLNEKKLSCQIFVNEENLSIGDNYTVRWNVVSVSQPQIKLNDEKVEASGSKTYVLGSTETGNYRLTANGSVLSKCDISINVQSD